MTERKRAEEEIRRAHAELDERVRQWTARLAEANAQLKREIAERRELEEQLTHKAFYDPLTGLPNRSLFLDRVELSSIGSLERGGKVAVLLVDLDNFKTINDSLGYEAGDRVLLAVAERLENAVGSRGTTAHFGGTSSPCCSKPSRAQGTRYGLPGGLRKSCEAPSTWKDSSGW